MNDRGDFERIEEIIKQAQTNRQKSCKFPEKIKVRQHLSPADGTPAEEWVITSRQLQSNTLDNQVVTGNTIEGFSCENSDQPGGARCKDYEVQLCCPGRLICSLSIQYRHRRDKQLPISSIMQFRRIPRKRNQYLLVL